MFEAEKRRLTEIARQNPIPCLVCASHELKSIGTWIPGSKYLLAVGGKGSFTPVFAFWLCDTHTPITDENERLISQSILREVRTGKKFTIGGG